MTGGESELNRILSAALATRECKQVIDEIERMAGKQAAEIMKADAGNAER